MVVTERLENLLSNSYDQSFYYQILKAKNSEFSFIIINYAFIMNSL
jgi:hypothetical protein